MSGELRLSQFRWTTTANDDLVIGNPAEAGLHNTKFIVFQATNTAGYAANPHFRCEWTGSAWAFKMNQGGGAGDLTLTGMAYLADGTLGTPQTFTGYNTFSGPVIASSTVNLSNNVTLGTNSGNTLTVHSAAQFNSNLTVSGNLTVNGTLTNVNTTNLEVKDKTITLNNGGGATSGNLSGIEIEENGSTTGYVMTSSTRAAWNLKAPSTSGIWGFTPGNFDADFVTGGGNVTLTLPATNGTLALNTGWTASRVLTSNGSGVLTPSTVTTTELDYLSGVTSAIQTQFSNAVMLAGTQTITGAKTFSSGSISITNGVYNLDITHNSAGDSQIRSKGSAPQTSFSILMDQGFSDLTGAYLYRDTTAGTLRLQLANDGSGGSSIELKDSVNGSIYRLYMASGVLNIALVP